MLRSSQTVAVRQVLAELELCSVVHARAYLPVVSGSSAGPRPPTGGESPADYWRRRFADAEPHELAALTRAARAELAAIRRRRFPVVRVRDGDDLRERIVADGEGMPAADVAIAFCCTRTFVRRVRLVAGRDAEHGRPVRPDDTLNAVELVAAGFSIRAAAVATGVPRTTLAAQLRRDTLNP